jgi:hypothetical protein
MHPVVERGLFTLLGFFPFLIINAVFAEIAFLIAAQPEGKSLGAILGLSFQLANISSFIYIYCAEKYRLPDTPALSVLSTLGLVVAILICALSPVTVNGHSVPLIVLVFMSGVVGCTGIVVLFGFAAKFDSKNTTFLSSGLAVSGCACALLSLIQTYKPSFGVTAYFGVVVALMALSVASYFALLAASKKQSSTAAEDADQREELVVATTKNEYADLDRPLVSAKFPLAMMFLTATMTYFMVPGIEPYLVDSDELLTWLANSYLVGNVCGRIVTAVPQLCTSRTHLSNLAQFICMGIMLLVGFLSHNGKTAIPFVMFVFSALNGYTNTMVYRSVHYSARVSRWASIANQCGALFGTLLSLAVVLSR